MMKKYPLLMVLCLLFAYTGNTQPIGIFDAAVEIGEPADIGFVEFSDGMYEIEGVGATAGRNVYNDQFFFIYKEVNGSFSIEGSPEPLSDGEVGLMIRNSLEPNAAHISFLMSGGTPPGGNTNAVNGSVFPYIRSLDGGGTIVDGDIEADNVFIGNHMGPIRLVRLGNSVHFYTFNEAGNWVLFQSEAAAFTDPVYTGIAALSWTDTVSFHEMSEVVLEELPLFVSRSIDSDTYQAGTPITVTITASAAEVVDASVSEVAPALGTISNPSASSGTVTEGPGGIIWTLDGFSGEATLTYTVTLSNTLDSVSFPGTFNYAGSGFPNSFLGGDLVLPKNPTWGESTEAVELDPDQPVVVQVENFQTVGTGISNNPDIPGFGLGMDPRLYSGIYAIQMGGNPNQGSIEIPINVPAGYGTLYAFGYVRGEDGNSDSFHTEIDAIPAGTDESRWDSGGGKSFHYDWVSRTTPAEDPRPFPVDAGEHTFYIGLRENSASIDFIVFSNTPSIAFSLFDPVAGQFAVAVPFENINVANPVPKPMVNGEVFFEAEEGNLIVTPANGSPHFAIYPDASASEGHFVYATVGSGGSTIVFDNRIDYWFEVQEAGTYRVIANTRTPSGNDDSFWVTMDNEQIVVSGIDDSFGGSGIQDNFFHTSWVDTNNAPDLSWELDAGPHVFNLYSREDGTQIDWLVITNNLDQDPLEYQPPTTSVDEFMLY
ncbi:MAG: hypothetical protein ACOX5R_22815 [bacterium]|jgi:hypothetical protein